MMKEIMIYTDGACSGNPGPGGWGAVLIYNSHEKEMSGYSEKTTNNIMELTAVCEALDSLKERCKVQLYSDSKYVVDGASKWMFSWAKKNWQRKTGIVKNSEIWKKLYNLNQAHIVEWIWVKGHAENKYNEVCDKIAREQIKVNTKL